MLIHELRGLCLDTQLLGGDQESSHRKSDAPSASASTAAPKAAAADDLLAGAMNLV